MKYSHHQMKYVLLTMMVLTPILLCMMPTVTNNKEMNMHNTVMESEITTTTVTYNQMMGTVTTLLVLYMLMTLIMVVNIINVSKESMRHIN